MSYFLSPVYVTLKGKGNFADMIVLRILRWGDDPGLSGWVLNAINVTLQERGTGRFDIQKRKR